MSCVNIVLSDSGWILERLASEISHRLPYCKFGLAADPVADIQYYITYSTWKKRVSKVEVGYFAHLELAAEANKKFFDVANAVDYAVCHSRKYEDILRGSGIDDVVTISPGVDFAELKPVTKIGVVGRTYHTGRKGESIIRKVMDVPGIEWHFTGEGWPGPARKIPEGQMGAFYNEMDYILVPALYEGGPMSVVEALACGCEVIAPPIGWVGEFPHIEYRTGDVEDLRRVLNGVVKLKTDLREAVLGRTWDAWADGHDRLFRELVKRHNLTPLESVGTHSSFGRIALVLHGDEGRALGGPSVRVPRTVQQLCSIGYEAELVNFPDPSIADAAVVHGFNVWSPVSGRQLVRTAVGNRTPLVLSSIFLDLSEREFWQNQLLALFGKEQDPDRIDVEIPRLRAAFRRDYQRGLFSSEGMQGHHQRVREMVGEADHVILLSEFEKRALERIGAEPKASTIVHNPVDANRFGDADPYLFSETSGVKDYILCVARIEPRKNQLMLLHALRDLDIPIVLIGHSTNQEYNALIERYVADNVHLVGRISPDDPLLPSAIAGCRVFTLPSWSEGAPLAALEAASVGANMVLSDRSSEREYFGDFARYCDPADPRSIRAAILDAYKNPLSAERKAELQGYIADRFSWEGYGRKTAEVYRKAIEAQSQRPRPSALRRATKRPSQKPKKIALDITTSCNHKGRWTGISRSEMSLAYSMTQDSSFETIFIAWHNGLRRFIEIPGAVLKNDYLSVYFEQAAEKDLRAIDISKGDALIVCGSAWMQNRVYAEQLVEICNKLELELSLVVHDIIPVKFPFWFEETYAGVFEHNLALILARANRIFGVSANTAQDVSMFASQRQLSIPAPHIYYQGADIGADQGGTSGEPSERTVRQFQKESFVLSVGAIHSRKNHRLLYDIWVSLAGQHGDRCPHLVIVGGVAWNGTDVARAFREDKRIKGLVHIVEGIDDPTLGWLYDNCMFTVYPSLYEGWGLPVAESLSHGKICIASSNSSVPEIAPTLTDLVDPQDFQAWRSRVDMYVISKAAREVREGEIRECYQPRTWKEATADLVSDLRRGSAQKAAGAIYTPGTTLNLTGANAALVKHGGWHVTESWGVWSSEHSARLRLELSEPARDDLVLTVQARALVQDGKPLYCGVRVNGVDIGRLSLHKPVAEYFSLVIPQAVAGSGSELDITFSINSLVSPATLKSDSTDGRLLGIGLTSILIANKADLPSPGKEIVSRGAKLPSCRVDQRVWLIGHPYASSFFTAPLAQDSQWGVRPSTGPFQVLLNVQEHYGQDLTMSFIYRACATSERPLRVLITDGTGVVLGQFEATDDSLHEQQIQLPWSVRQASSPHVLSFSFLKNGSPAALGIGHLQEGLGLGLFGLSVESGQAPVLGLLEPEDASLIPMNTYVKFEAVFDNRRFVDSSTWHEQESAGFWSVGRMGRLVVGLHKRPSRDLQLELDCAPLVSFDHGNTFEVLVNDVAQDVLIVPEGSGYRLYVDVSIKSLAGTWGDTPALKVDIVTVHAQTAFRLGRGYDDRIMGFFIYGFGLHEMPVSEIPVAFGQRLDMGFQSNGQPSEGARYLRPSTWHQQELDGFWSRGERGRVVFSLESAPQGSLVLEILGSPFISFNQGNEVEISINGVACPVMIEPDDSQYRITVPILPPRLPVDQNLGSRFEVDISVLMHGNPSDPSASGDSRDLGFFLRTIVVRQGLFEGDACTERTRNNMLAPVDC